MAGIYSGIHLQLKTPKIAWDHKLKLAHFAWISHQCCIPNKEQFLLDWVSQTLVGFHTKKQTQAEDAEQKFWLFLDNILHSKRLKSLMEEGKSLKLRFAIAQVMNDIFAITPTQTSLPAGIGTVLSCCQVVLSTPCFGKIYKAKYELIVDLLSKLGFLACLCLTSEHALAEQVLNVLNISLKQYTLLQRQQINANRLFVHVLTQLFESCLRLRNTLNSQVFDKDSNIGTHQLIKDIRNNIDVVLHTGLFQAELLTFYKDELLQLEKSEKKKGPFRDCLTPVCSILIKLEEIDFQDKEKKLSFLANCVPLLYKLFLDSYCKDGNELLCFQMLVKLFGCLSAPFTQVQDDMKVLFPTWSAGLSALECMLNLVLSHNIYNIAEDNIRGKGVQYKFYRSLIEILVCTPCTPSLPWFRCLKALNLLNPLIVEPNLTDILRACFNSDTSDMSTRKAQEALVVSLLNTYLQLRQFPKLFEKILLVLCQPATEGFKDQILLSRLTEKLTGFLVQLPPNQMLDMWELVVKSCRLPRTEDDPSHSINLQHLGSLLQCLMMNMKTIDSNTPMTVIHRFQHLMKQIAEELILPSLTILKKESVEAEETSKICDFVLMLLSSWVEVNTVTALNCEKYVSQMGKLAFPLESPLEYWNFSIFFEDKECWHKVHTLCSQSNVFSMYYLRLLSIQKIKVILMHIHMPNENERATLQASASFIVNSSINLMNHKDQNPNHGSVIDCPWHFIVSNITILVPFISPEDMNMIADYLLETQLSASDKNNDPISLKGITKSLLLSDSFSEMCVLQCVFITCIFKKCATLVRRQTVLHEIIDLLSLQDSDWHEYIISIYNKGAKIVNPKVNYSCDDSVFVTNMKHSLQLVSSGAKMNEFVSFTDDDINLLMNLIELISVLNPDSLLPSDLCRCFFLLVALANAGSVKSVNVASACYRSLTCLLSGTHANHLFKIAYASDILEAMMTCIQTTDWNVSEAHAQDWATFLDIVNLFFDTFLSVVMKRKQSVLVNLEKCTSFVLNSLTNMKRTYWSTCKGQLHIVILKNICHHLTLAAKEQDAKGEYGEGLTNLLKRVTVELKTVIQHCLQITVSSPFLPSLLVTSTTTLLEAELSAGGNLHNTEMYRVFRLQIVKELCYAKDQTTFLKSALHYLTVCIAVKEIYSKQQGFVTSVFTTLGNLLASPWFNNEILKYAEMELQNLLNGVTENCTCEEFHALLKLIFNKLELCNLWKKSYKVLFSGITMIRLLLNCTLQKDKSVLFWSSASQIITALVTLSIEANKERLLISAVVAPVLDTMALFLRRGELFLSNPQHVTLTLSTLQMVSLENVKTEDYYSIFLAIHEVLFSVLQCHPKVMLNSVPTFLSCFQRLVASVMHEGRQKGDGGTACILKCARLVERMYTYIAAKTEEFTVFSTFIVSQYIHELQKVTLQPEVKKSLTEGIFHIFDLCIDRDIKFLNTSLQTGAREVFKELYQDYSLHYKTRNQEEEKYTVY
ncbi:unhealthy ribosome biogenesis protein 2 homolog [Leptodactylus fuscus]|uniref:unhealthy ribosome biogenesis protein 2 homolog n=1 Tax=Leptodactylus fuscus TaxID=238119 RepID=UPI003F4EE990